MSSPLARTAGSSTFAPVYRLHLMGAPPAGDRLRLFNTLTRRVAEFGPASPPDVGMYSCGPTVYADQHIGNMRSYVFADTVKRAFAGRATGCAT